MKLELKFYEVQNIINECLSSSFPNYTHLYFKWRKYSDNAKPFDELEVTLEDRIDEELIEEDEYPPFEEWDC